jgi:IS66 C-terminal element
MRQALEKPIRPVRPLHITILKLKNSHRRSELLPNEIDRISSAFDGPARDTEEGGRIETCELNAVEPYHYLADVITRIVDGHPNSHLDELLP